MRLLYYTLLISGIGLSTLGYAQEASRPYGMLFSPGVSKTASEVLPAQPVQASIPTPSSGKLEQKPPVDVVLLPPPQVVPSAQPATFEGHEEDARRAAEYAQRKHELHLKTLQEAERARANAPTVVVLQQPNPEMTLWNAITSVPAMVVRHLLR